MRDEELLLTDLPELTPELACQVLDFLYAFINAFENRYADQLRQPTPQADCQTGDLFAIFDDDIP